MTGEHRVSTQSCSSEYKLVLMEYKSVLMEMYLPEVSTV